MSARRRQAAVVVGMLAALQAATVPPAQATTKGTLKFELELAVGTGDNGIADPCFTGLPMGGVPQVDLNLCTLTTGTPPFTTKPKPSSKHPGDVMVNVAINRPAVGMMVISTRCAGAIVNTNKAAKSATEGPFCKIIGGGTIAGHCNLATGAMAGGIHNDVPPPPVPPSQTPFQDYAFSLKFTITGPNLTFHGSITLGGRNGWVKGRGTVTVDPARGSCTNKHPLVLVVKDGVMDLLIANP